MEIKPIERTGKFSRPRVEVTFDSRREADDVDRHGCRVPVSMLAVGSLIMATAPDVRYPMTVTMLRADLDKIVVGLNKYITGGQTDPEVAKRLRVLRDEINAALASPQESSSEPSDSVTPLSVEELRDQAIRAAWQVEPHAVPANLAETGPPPGHIAFLPQTPEL